MSKSNEKFYIVYNYDEFSLPVGIFDNCNDLAEFFGKNNTAIRISINNYKRHKIKSIERNTDKKHFIIKRWKKLKNGNVREY